MSELLGKIQSELDSQGKGITHIRSSVDVMGDKVDKISERVIINENGIKAAHQQIKEMKPHVESAKKTKWTMGAILVSVGAVFSTLGGAIIKLFISVTP